MAETLGSLCDKLTIVLLKQYHSRDANRLDNLAGQEKQLCEEIDNYIRDAIVGVIPPERLVFSSNKVYKQEGNEIHQVSGFIGTIFSELARVNCDLWHQQEKVYDFEKVHPDEKNDVVRQLALLNLQRTRYIDEIDKKFQELLLHKH